MGEAWGGLGRLGEGLGNAWGTVWGGLGDLERLALSMLGLSGEVLGGLGRLGECLGMLWGGLGGVGEGLGRHPMRHLQVTSTYIRACIHTYIHTYIHTGV